MKMFTIEEFRNYLQSQDSFGDALYHLSEKNIERANEVEDDDSLTFNASLEYVLGKTNKWEDFCDEFGFSEWVVNEGGGDIVVKLTVKQAQKYGLI